MYGLTVIVPGGGEGIDDLTVGDGEGRMGNQGGDHVDGARGKEVFLAADDHFQLAFDDIGNLFVDVFMFGAHAAFFDLPEDEGAGVAVDHFSCEAGKCIFNGYIVKVLHVCGFCRKDN